jgi:hypothetical protein
MVTGAYRNRDYRMGDVDSDAFQAVPREFAVKAEPSPEATPKALLTKALRRLYQPICGAKPERFGQLLIELDQRLADRRKD